MLLIYLIMTEGKFYLLSRSIGIATAKHGVQTTKHSKVISRIFLLACVVLIAVQVETILPLTLGLMRLSHRHFQLILKPFDIGLDYF